MAQRVAPGRAPNKQYLHSRRHFIQAAWCVGGLALCYGKFIGEQLAGDYVGDWREPFWDTGGHLEERQSYFEGVNTASQDDERGHSGRQLLGYFLHT